MENTPKILYVSSADPLSGPGAIGLNHFKQLREAGLNADMLTLMKVPSHPEIMYVKERTLWMRIQEYSIARYKKIFGFKNKDTLHVPYCFFYEKENRPPVPIKQVLKPLKHKQYDLVIVYFWQQLLSFETVEAIYDKYHPVIFFLSPDFSHMSGGCHFPGDCKGFITGCGRCPAIGSNDDNDFTRWNVIYRKRFYEKVKPVVFGNSYMLSFFKKSFLLKDVEIVRNTPVIDTQNFLPINKDVVRKKYNIPEEKRFVIGFGCQYLNDPRKGMTVLIEALNVLYKQMNETDRLNVHIVTAGNRFEEIKNKIPFSSQGLGMLPVSQLSEFYSLCQIFVCPSVNDPGPSMVAQSIACGTPVVGFEMGAMIDFVKDRGTGMCVEVGNPLLLSEAMGFFFKMQKKEYESYVRHCLSFAKSCNSDTRLTLWLDVFNDQKLRCKV